MDGTSSQREQHDRAIFYPVAVVAVLFCVSVLVCIAATFGDPENPFNEWINRHVLSILLGESALLLAVSVGAMGLDRRNTLRTLAGKRQPDAPLDEPGSGRREALDDVG